jgi:hypothetical protein
MNDEQKDATAVAEPTDVLLEETTPVTIETVELENIPSITHPKIDDDMADEIFAARVELREREADHEEAKAQAKAAKDAMEAAQKRLNRLIDEASRGPGPLFQNAPAAPATAERSEAWRDVRLDTLDIAPGILEKLAEAGIDTIGAVVAHSEAHPNKGLRTIPGIGPEKAEAVADALAKYWEQHPRDATDAAADVIMNRLEDDPVGAIIEADEETLPVVLAAITDGAILNAARDQLHDEKWRDAILARMNELNVVPTAIAERQDTIDTIVSGSRRLCTEALAACTDADLLEEALPLTDGWRADAIMARLDELAEAPLAGAH